MLSSLILYCIAYTSKPNIKSGNTEAMFWYICFIGDIKIYIVYQEYQYIKQYAELIKTPSYYAMVSNCF